ncbi:hypothetical protein ACIOZL_41605 [Streptomyces sp. NPDC087769]|uniref:hypothetical protein n=1 Tax=Streptomyces sp. NPDC087769 TaxID=3365802 RepID=UPI0038022560
MLPIAVMLTTPGGVCVKRQGPRPANRTVPEEVVAQQHQDMFAPGGSQDIAVRVGPFVERAHTRPGDDHGPEMIAVALVHPDTPHAGAYLHGRQLGYTGRGWLRCETSAILGV